MRVAVNLGAIEGFESLPIGTYLGQISRMQYREPSTQGKFASIMVTYVVIEEGGNLGRKQSEWLSLSPKALWRMKKWMSKFGLSDLPEFDKNDETGDLIEPDLVDFRVIFKVSADGERMRTELISVEDDVSDVSVPVASPPTQPTTPARRGPAPNAQPDPHQAAPVAAPVAAVDEKAAKMAALMAELEALKEEPEDEPAAEQEAIAAVVPTAVVPRRRAAPVAAAGERRTLR